ncbi:PAS domain-containing sensor histidine kinase [Pontibacter diazotrophicus]|uniref:histidine kinase n=1 Tax=Pontibacter diazotrophicus TaxID=1400979 RepID=A0A3D8LAZ5_9BACT|nr:PAS domain-containing sensor histidine kinase [Pontibacter diazotrophicus]RDV14575.1 PAS domain-containing sensor histidine kinase [Pontibacter diazotrophicus]
MDPHYSEESINSFFINQIKDYAIFATDTKGIITAWNIGAERLKGYTEKEIVGQFYGILHPYEYQQAGVPEQELDIALEKGSYDVEAWRKRKDDSLFWATVTLTPIFSADGQHVGYTKITGDISKQKELQDKLAERQQGALEHKNKELQKINHDLDNFVYTASHDLRSPIANIEALTKLLKEELTESDCLSTETDEILQRVLTSISRFKSTIEDLTVVSRLQNDVSEGLTDEIINIKEVYEDIIADLGYPTELNVCFIQTDFKVYQLRFSKKNLRSILYNLISNAIKFQSPERDCIIKIHTQLEEPYVVLSVEDNGVGIDELHHEHLFTMFKRFHEHVEGTGIGLFMVKRIVENAGGKIEVESKKGIGTEFKIYFKEDM